MKKRKKERKKEKKKTRKKERKKERKKKRKKERKKKYTCTAALRTSALGLSKAAQIKLHTNYNPQLVTSNIKRYDYIDFQTR